MFSPDLLTPLLGYKRSTFAMNCASLCILIIHPSSSWSFYVPLFGTLIVLGLLYWKRHSHPLNIGLLSIFTLLEAFTLGIVTAFYPDTVVLQALLITTGVFLGLTLFTLQSKVCSIFAYARSSCVNSLLVSMTSLEWAPGCSVVSSPSVSSSLIHVSYTRGMILI